MPAALRIEDLTASELCDVLRQGHRQPTQREMRRARWRTCSAAWIAALEAEGKAQDEYLAAFGAFAEPSDNIEARADLAREAMRLRQQLDQLTETRRKARDAERAAHKDLDAA